MLFLVCIKIRKHKHNYIIDQNIQYKSMSCPEMLSDTDTNILIFPPSPPPPPPKAKNHVASKQECAHLRARTKQYVIKVPPLPHTTKRFSYIPAYSYRIKIKNSTATFCKKSTRQYSKPIFQNSCNSYSD